MEGVEKKMGMELHLESLQFTGGERLLILVLLALLSLQTFQVVVSMGRHNDRNEDQGLVGKSVPDHLDPGLKRARQVLMKRVIVGRNQHPEYACVKKHKGNRSKAHEKHI